MKSIVKVAVAAVIAIASTTAAASNTRVASMDFDTCTKRVEVFANALPTDVIVNTNILVIVKIKTHDNKISTITCSKPDRKIIITTK